MARDKLITIRIEGEKREAFNNLAKSQNTDTASLLYDFISGCLGGKIDISLVTGKGNRIDKIDNQIDSDRIDKLEATTQEIDNRLDTITKKLTDWVIAFDDRLNDCGRELSEKMISLEHRLNALAMQLDSQQDSQQLDSIDTDSQQLDSIDTDSQQIDDMEPLLKRERESSIATSPLPPIEETSPLPPLAQPAIESVTDSKPWYTIDDLLDCHYSGWPKTKEGLRKKALTECWPRRTRRGSKGNPYEYQAVLPE